MDRFSLILQFMPGKENELIEHWKPDLSTEVTLAYGFCLLVRQLQDKDSKVCTRTQYCITALKQASLEVGKEMLCRYTYRSSVLVFKTMTASSLTVVTFILAKAVWS